MHSAAGVVGPLLSGVLFERYGAGAPGAVAGGLCLAACAVFVGLVGDGTARQKTKVE